MYKALLGTLLAATVLVGLAIAGSLIILIWKKDLTKKLSYIRLFVQVVSLVVIFYSFTLPLWLSLFVLGIFAVTIFSGRFFCGWICPFGFYMDIVALIRQKLKIRYHVLPEKVNVDLHKFRYLIAAAILISPLFLGALTITDVSGVQAEFLRGPYRPLDILLSPLEPLVVPWTGVLGDLGFIQWSFSYPYARDIQYYVNIDMQPLQRC
jgi:polyferredoxin